MGKIQVLVEVTRQQNEAFSAFSAAMDSEMEALRQGEDALASLAGMGLDVLPDFAPVPMFGAAALTDTSPAGLVAFAAAERPRRGPAVTVGRRMSWNGF